MRNMYDYAYEYEYQYHRDYYEDQLQALSFPAFQDLPAPFQIDDKLRCQTRLQRYSQSDLLSFHMRLSVLRSYP